MGKSQMARSWQCLNFRHGLSSGPMKMVTEGWLEPLVLIPSLTIEFVMSIR
jgi:hypothetical protein